MTLLCVEDEISSRFCMIFQTAYSLMMEQAESRGLCVSLALPVPVFLDRDAVDRIIPRLYQTPDVEVRQMACHFIIKRHPYYLSSIFLHFSTERIFWQIP